MSLQDDLFQLAEWDRRVIRAFMQSDPEGLKTALKEYQTLRRDIRVRPLDQTVVSISDRTTQLTIYAVRHSRPAFVIFAYSARCFRISTRT